MGLFSNEFSHSSPNPDGCCLFTLLMLLAATSLIVGAIVAGIWWAAS